jgi:hypothetical protein
MLPRRGREAMLPLISEVVLMSYRKANSTTNALLYICNFKLQTTQPGMLFGSRR